MKAHWSGMKRADGPKNCVILKNLGPSEIDIPTREQNGSVERQRVTEAHRVKSLNYDFYLGPQVLLRIKASKPIGYQVW